MRLTVNGEYRVIAAGANVADLVQELAGQPRGIAVAVNGEVLPRTQWTVRVLADGDAVEILTAVQGG